jgi:hypothetical protein
MTLFDGIELEGYASPQEDVLAQAHKWIPADGFYRSTHGLPVLGDHRITINAYGVPGAMTDFCADLGLALDGDTVSASVTRIRHKVNHGDSIMPTGILARDGYNNQIDVLHPQFDRVVGYIATVSTKGPDSILSAILPDGSEVELSGEAVNDAVPEYMAKIIICAVGEDVKSGVVVGEGSADV